jgi:hypothetical protein
MGMNYVIDYKTLEGTYRGFGSTGKGTTCGRISAIMAILTFKNNFYQAMIKTSDRDVSGARRGF